jgi:hypothetical protein
VASHAHAPILGEGHTFGLQQGAHGPGRAEGVLARQSARSVHHSVGRNIVVVVQGGEGIPHMAGPARRSKG